MKLIDNLTSSHKSISRKKLRDKNKINLCMHLSSGGADTTLAHVYPAMIALLFAVGGIFQKNFFSARSFEFKLITVFSILSFNHYWVEISLYLQRR